MRACGKAVELKRCRVVSRDKDVDVVATVPPCQHYGSASVATGLNRLCEFGRFDNARRGNVARAA
jgi:hypothetical protein